jgi:phosphoribosyl 1,2-cyclic phosphodiesterase
MDIRPWGTRGSVPSPSPSTARYGGNTSCLECRLRDGTLIIFDAGTGIRPLGAALGVCDATVLLSHYHWDHIQGFPFFGSAFFDDSNIVVYGPEFEGKGPEEILLWQMHEPYFPADPSQLRGIKDYRTATTEPFSIGSASVRATRVSHPSVTYGYRVEDEGGVFVYISDNEVDVATEDTYRNIVELARGADLLLHDCQYFEHEYSHRQGWGHSTPRQALKIAREAGVQRLMLFHHDPSHTDEQVEAMAEEARAIAGDIEILIGREGESVTVRQSAAVHPGRDSQ